MTKKTRVWLIVASALVVAGIILCAGMLYLAKGNLGVFSTVKYETRTYEPSGDFVAISIATDTADIVFLPSPDGKTRVVCHEDPKASHTVKVEDNFLKISLVNEKKWYDYISVADFSEGESITVYLTRGNYNALYIDAGTADVTIPQGYRFMTADIHLSTGDVEFSSTSGDTEISTSTGSITLENLSAGFVELSTSTGSIDIADMKCHDLELDANTGKVTLSDVSCYSLIAESDTGDITMKNVTAETPVFQPNFSVETDTGDVELEACDAFSMEIKTNTGDISGSLLSEKRIYAESDTGHIDVPEVTDDFDRGYCKIESNTGDIKIEILP